MNEGGSAEPAQGGGSTSPATFIGPLNQPSNEGGSTGSVQGGGSSSPLTTLTGGEPNPATALPTGGAGRGAKNSSKKGGRGPHIPLRQPGNTAGKIHPSKGGKTSGKNGGPQRTRTAGGVENKGDPKFTLFFTKGVTSGEDLVGEASRVLFRIPDHFTVSRVRSAGPARAQLSAHDEESSRVVGGALRADGYSVETVPVWARYTFEVPGDLSSLTHVDIVEGLMVRNRFGGFPQDGLRYVGHLVQREADMGRGRGRGRGAGRRSVRVGDIARMFVEVSPAGVEWLRGSHFFLSTGPGRVLLFPAGDRRPTAQQPSPSDHNKPGQS